MGVCNCFDSLPKNRTMSIDLYHMDASAPCRSVRLTAKMLGVELNLKVLNLMAGEQMAPEFIKINPQHNIPTMVDDGFAMNEPCHLRLPGPEVRQRRQSLPERPQGEGRRRPASLLRRGRLLPEFRKGLLSNDVRRSDLDGWSGQERLRKCRRLP